MIQTKKYSVYYDPTHTHVYKPKSVTEIKFKKLTHFPCFQDMSFKNSILHCIKLFLFYLHMDNKYIYSEFFYEL